MAITLVAFELFLLSALYAMWGFAGYIEWYGGEPSPSTLQVFLPINTTTTVAAAYTAGFTVAESLIAGSGIILSYWAGRLTAEWRSKRKVQVTVRPLHFNSGKPALVKVSCPNIGFLLLIIGDWGELWRVLDRCKRVSDAAFYMEYECPSMERTVRELIEITDEVDDYKLYRQDKLCISLLEYHKL